MYAKKFITRVASHTYIFGGENKRDRYNKVQLFMNDMQAFVGIYI